METKRFVIEVCMNSKILSTHFWIVKCEFHSFVGEIEVIGLEHIRNCRFWLTSFQGKESYGHNIWNSKTSFSHLISSIQLLKNEQNFESH